MSLPKHHPQYGGTLTYYKDMEVGTRFYVMNGHWSGEIIEVEGIKKVMVEEDVNRAFLIEDDRYAWININK